VEWRFKLALHSGWLYNTYKFLTFAIYAFLRLCCIWCQFCGQNRCKYPCVINVWNCSQLMVYDVVTQRLDQIPSLQGRRDSVTLPQDQQCGIHSVQINPSKTLLATGARNSSEIAVYRLPTLDPVCVGEVSMCLSCSRWLKLNKEMSFHVFDNCTSVAESLYILFFF